MTSLSSVDDKTPMSKRIITLKTIRTIQLALVNVHVKKTAAKKIKASVWEYCFIFKYIENLSKSARPNVKEVMCIQVILLLKY